MKIAILGTGSLGTHLGLLIQKKTNHELIYGSRNPENAKGRVSGTATVATYADAVANAELVIIALPWSSDTNNNALDILQSAGSFAGKVVVDATNPVASDWSPVILGAENSAGEQIAQLLPDARVVKAFNTIFADMMVSERLKIADIPITLFLCGDDTQAKDTVQILARQLGFNPRDTGFLKNSRYLEAMAHLNIQIAVTMGGGTHAAFLYVTAPHE